VNLRTRLRYRLGRLCLALGNRLLGNKEKSQTIWIDVGAHLGERTLHFAQNDPSLIVYAFEPNLKIAAQRFGVLSNFVVIPMAVAEDNGCTNFYVNTFDAASSLLPFDRGVLDSWVSDVELEVEGDIVVPTIRLETFMNWLKIPQIDYLKIDTQGSDFAVIKSAGERLRDIRKIQLEVAVTPSQLYVGAASKAEVVDYLEQAGFALVEVESQSHDQEENLTFVRRT